MLVCLVQLSCIPFKPESAILQIFNRTLSNRGIQLNFLLTPYIQYLFHWKVAVSTVIFSYKKQSKTVVLYK